MPGQCYRGRQRHDPLQLAPERTERGRHRQPSAGEASKTTPAPLTEPHLIPVCRYVPCWATCLQSTLHCKNNVLNG